MIFDLSRFIRWLLAFLALFILSLTGIAFFEVSAPNTSPNIVNTASFPNLDTRQIPNPLLVGELAECDHKLCENDDDCNECPNTSCQQLHTSKAALKGGYGNGTGPLQRGKSQGFCLQNSADSPNGKVEYDFRVQNLLWGYTGLQQWDAIDSYPTFFKSDGRGDTPYSLACNAPSNTNSAPSVAGGGNRLMINPLLSQQRLQYAFDESATDSEEKVGNITLGMSFLDVRGKGIGIDPYAIIRQGKMKGEPVFKCNCGDGYLQVPGDPYNCHRDHCWPFWPLTTTDDVYSQTQCNPALGCRCNCVQKVTPNGIFPLVNKVLRYPKWDPKQKRFLDKNTLTNHMYYTSWPTRQVHLSLHSDVDKHELKQLKQEIEKELERYREFWGLRRYRILSIEQSLSSKRDVDLQVSPELDSNVRFEERQVRRFFFSGRTFGRYRVTKVNHVGEDQVSNHEGGQFKDIGSDTDYNFMIPEWDATFYDNARNNLCTDDKSSGCITNYLLGTKCASGYNLCSVGSNSDAPTTLKQMSNLQNNLTNHLGCSCVPHSEGESKSAPVSMLCSSKNVLRPRSQYSLRELDAQDHPNCADIDLRGDKRKICLIPKPEKFQVADPRFSVSDSDSLEWFVNKKRDGYLPGMCTQDYHCGKESRCNKEAGWCQCLDPLNPIGSECYDPIFDTDEGNPCIGDSDNGMYINSPPFYMCTDCGGVEFPFSGFRIDANQPPNVVELSGSIDNACSVGTLDTNDNYLSNYPQLPTQGRTLNLCNITKMGVTLTPKQVRDAAGNLITINVPKDVAQPDKVPSVGALMTCSKEDDSQGACHAGSVSENYIGPPKCEWKLLPPENEREPSTPGGTPPTDEQQRFMLRIWQPDNPVGERQFGCCANGVECTCGDKQFHNKKSDCPLAYQTYKSGQEWLYETIQKLFSGADQTHLLDTDAIASSLPDDLRDYYCPWVLMPVCDFTYGNAQGIGSGKCHFPDKPFRLCYRLCEGYNNHNIKGRGAEWQFDPTSEKYIIVPNASPAVRYNPRDPTKTKGLSEEDPVLCFVTRRTEDGTDLRFLNPPDEQTREDFFFGCDPDLRRFVEFSTTANRCSGWTDIKGNFALTSQQMVCKSSNSIYTPDPTRAHCDFDNLSYLDSTENSSDGFTDDCSAHCHNCHRRWELGSDGTASFCKNAHGDWGCCRTGPPVVGATWCQYPFCGTYNDNDKDDFDPVSAPAQGYCGANHNWGCRDWQCRADV